MFNYKYLFNIYNCASNTYFIYLYSDLFSFKYIYTFKYSFLCI